MLAEVNGYVSHKKGEKEVIVKKFKNGNVSIRYEKDYDHKVETFAEMVCLITTINELDIIGISEIYCVGNSCVGYDILTVYGAYPVLSIDFDKFISEKTVKLYRRNKNEG